jgi:hypothetical protein
MKTVSLEQYCRFGRRFDANDLRCTDDGKRATITVLATGLKVTGGASSDERTRVMSAIVNLKIKATSKYVFASGSPDPIPMSEGDRRFMVKE